MRDLHALRVFMAVHRHRSFARAARELSLTPASVTRAISALEQDLGQALFVRTTRHVTPTPEGDHLVTRITPLLAELDDTLSAMRSATGEDTGTLRISLPLAFGTRVMPPVLSKFRTQFPGIALRLHFTDQAVTLSDGNVDMAIRISQLPESGATIQRKIAPVRRFLVAAPNAPETRLSDPSDLPPERLLGHGPASETELWRLSNGTATRRIVAGTQVMANSGDVLADMALAGVGVAQLPEFIVDDHIRQKRLLRVLPAWSCMDLWLTLAYPPYGTLPHLVARFSQFVEDALTTA